MALTGIQIFKLLPKTNCRECGVNTCLAFAMKLAARKAEIADCPYASDEAIEVLALAEHVLDETSTGPAPWHVIESTDRRYLGVTAARKGRQILDNVENVLAIEYLCAAQGREFHTELTAGTGADAAHKLLRKSVKALKNDRFLQPDIEAARELIASGALVAAVESVVGPLDA